MMVANMLPDRIVDRDVLLRKVADVASGRLDLADFQAWTAQVVAADSWDISDEDAHLVAPVLNAFEDDGAVTGGARQLAMRLLAVLESKTPGDLQAGLLTLATAHHAIARVVREVAAGRVSRMGLLNSLSKSGLDRGVRDRILQLSDDSLRALASHLDAQDYRQAVSLLAGAG